MRTFVIADASKRKAKPIGVLFWEADPANKQGRFSLELSAHCSENDAPLSLSFLASRDSKTAMPDESEDWVRSRIVPEDRHNIVEVLLANGLSEYDEASLLAVSMGRSSDDDFLVYEVAVPDELLGCQGVLADEASACSCESRADRLIAAVERRRNKSDVYYAFIGFPEAGHSDKQDDPERMPGSAVCTLRQSSAQSIGAQIRKRRIQAGLTQKQFAAKAGITQSVLSRIESGKGNPTLSLLEEIAAALDSSLDIRLA